MISITTVIEASAGLCEETYTRTFESIDKAAMFSW